MVLSFVFNKKTLVGINVVYIFVAFFLMGAGSYAKYSTFVDSLPLVGGIFVCGIFLTVVALYGIAAIFKKSQSWMFYYMIFLGIIFVFQFFISIACLGASEKNELSLAKSAWKSFDDHSQFTEIHSAEKALGCCGFDSDDGRTKIVNYKNKNSSWSQEIDWCIENVSGCKVPKAEKKNTNINRGFSSSLNITCPTCQEVLKGKINAAFNKAGGLGLFFALTEAVTLIITHIYREQCAKTGIIS